jgi:hypothetical protein
METGRWACCASPIGVHGSNKDAERNLTMGFQVTEVQKSLKGFDYPGSPEDLANHAEKHGADDELVEALRNLPRTFSVAQIRSCTA